MTFSGIGRASRFTSLVAAIDFEIADARQSDGRITKASIRNALREKGFRFRDSTVNSVISLYLPTEDSTSILRFNRDLKKQLDNVVKEKLTKQLPDIVLKRIRNSSYQIQGMISISYSHRGGEDIVYAPFDFTVQGHRIIDTDPEALVLRHFAGRVTQIARNDISSDESNSYYQDIRDTLLVQAPEIVSLEVSSA